MSERIILSAWRLLLMAMIGTGGVAAVWMLYGGLLSVLSMHWQSGAPLLANGALLAGAVFLLCRHRNDLVYS